MKKYILLVGLFFSLNTNLFAQMVVDAPVVESLLTTMNSILSETSTTQNLTKAEAIKNATANAENLSVALETVEKLSKVTNYIKNGKTIAEIYATEQKIIKNLSLLKSDFDDQFSSNDTSKITEAFLNTTGFLIDKAVQIITDDIFSMNDFEREKALESILSKLKQIEGILGDKFIDFQTTNISFEKNYRDGEKADRYKELVKKRREKINSINN